LVALGPELETVASFARHHARARQIRARRSRSAFVITDTDDRLIAAAAKIGETRMPKNG
jgi:hypothetical protein